MKVIIVGGVAGGASAAARIRRLDENAQIIVFERTSFISYANCGLPYYVGGIIQNEEDLTLQTPEGSTVRAAFMPDSTLDLLPTFDSEKCTKMSLFSGFLHSLQWFDPRKSPRYFQA